LPPHRLGDSRHERFPALNVTDHRWMEIDPLSSRLDDLLVEVPKAQPLRHASRDRLAFGAGEMRDADDSLWLSHYPDESTPKAVSRRLARHNLVNDRQGSAGQGRTKRNDGATGATTEATPALVVPDLGLGTKNERRAARHSAEPLAALICADIGWACLWIR
jgi:hypothetical protein